MSSSHFLQYPEPLPWWILQLGDQFNKIVALPLTTSIYKSIMDGFTCSFAHGFDNSFVKSLIKIGFIEVLLYPSSVLGRSPLQSESKNNLMSLHSTIVTLAGHLMQSYFSSKSTNCHHMSCFLEAAMGPTVLSFLYDRHSVKFVIRIFRMPWKRKLM